jgi:hypothetical protein
MLAPFLERENKPDKRLIRQAARAGGILHALNR